VLRSLYPGITTDTHSNKICVGSNVIMKRSIPTRNWSQIVEHIASSISSYCMSCEGSVWARISHCLIILLSVFYKVYFIYFICYLFTSYYGVCGLVISVCLSILTKFEATDRSPWNLTRTTSRYRKSVYICTLLLYHEQFWHYYENRSDGSEPHFISSMTLCVFVRLRENAAFIR
jgi:hypothetical protein